MATPPGCVKYFFGRITREESEKYLQAEGLEDGLFLLRESMRKMGEYVLSLCFQGSIHHYSILRQDDGQMQIENGKKFPGPVELLDYHKKHRGGLQTYLKNSCNRPTGKSYVVFRGVASHEIDRMLVEKAIELKTPSSVMDEVLVSHRSKFIDLIKVDLHKQQQWYHGSITREEADAALKASGLEDGKYLLRAQAGRPGEWQEYRLTLCHSGKIKHYVITNKNNKLFIETGPPFESLIELVDYYHNKADGLLCPLKVPCNCLGGSSMTPSSSFLQSPIYGNAATVEQPVEPDLPTHGIIQPNVPTLPLNGRVEKKKSTIQQATFTERPPSTSTQHDLYEDPGDSDSYEDPLAPYSQDDGKLREMAEENQKIYDSLPAKSVLINLPRESIELQGELGSGFFGSVLKGLYKKKGHKIPVAVKTLKGEDLGNGRDEIMKEAQIMARLMHKHIVRIIGLVQDETLMLVLELAEQGPLHTFLKSRREFPMKKIALLMYQVALGMEFLESQKFVHRDLAARNVLLASDTFAKISDFGLSKAIGSGNEYYKAAKPGKWPLKWYAPESTYYCKFTPKSDVWSYGVTLWEATSYGMRPYRGKKKDEILSSIERGERLLKPTLCSDGLYEIMLKCWKYDASDRPSFTDIVKLMKPHAAAVQFE